MASDKMLVHVKKLPVGGAGCGDIRLVGNGLELFLEFEFRREGRDLIGSVKFGGLIAHRFFGEMHSQGFVPSSYDNIIEITESAWQKHLFKIEPANMRCGASEKRHYCVFISNNGYLEAIADSCELLDERPGLLNETLA